MDQKRIRELEQKISTDYGNTTGVAVLKEGKLVYEKYFKGCTRESQVHVYSVTKSIISILIGIAVDGNWPGFMLMTGSLERIRKSGRNLTA